MTRSVADNAAMLTAISGFDPHDAGSVRHRLEDFGPLGGAGTGGLRVGIPEAYFEHLDPEVGHQVGTALEAWAQAGGTIRPVAVPGLDKIIAAERTVLAVEPTVHRDRLQSQPEQFQERSRSGAATLPPCRPGRTRKQPGSSARFGRRSTARWPGGYARHPGRRVPAPRIGQLYAATTGLPETVQAALTRLTCATNFSGHPSLTVPCGRTQLGLPVGVQLIGRYWDEAVLYRAGQALMMPCADRPVARVPPMSSRRAFTVDKSGERHGGWRGTITGP